MDSNLWDGAGKSRAVEDGGVKRDRFTASLSSERKIYRAAKQRREIHSEEASRVTEK